MIKDPKIFFTHILDSISAIQEYLAGHSEIDFKGDQQLQDSVFRRFEIIGEAVKHIPNSIKQGHPDIPWQEIAGMRDILIHEYFAVDLTLMWNTAQDDLPRFKTYIEKILLSL